MTQKKLCLAILLCAVVAFAQVRDPLPVPDIPGYRTLKCDFHMHTVFSDGEVWPTVRLNEAFRDGLDVISITDHAVYNPRQADVKIDLARPHELIRVAAERMGIILIQGIEFGEGDIHANALFVTDPNSLRSNELLVALRGAVKQGAFTFWNHPGWRRKVEWFPLIASAYDEKLLHGMELVNGATFYGDAYPYIEEKKLGIIGTSDVHGLIPGRGRALTLVFARTADAAGVKEALFARRSAAWMGGEIWGFEEHLRGLWEGAIKVENPDLTWHPGLPGAFLRLRNLSAIPFRFRVVDAPKWLSLSGGEIREEKTLGVPLRIAKDTPPGMHSIELGLEITNLHVGPGQNLRVKLPLRLEAGKSIQ
ncbi:MAG: histidinol-phosphatase [Acidobacteria bacterium]|nr:histidinol-phosphatase [Acidobacteriota bacterium]